MTLAQSSLPATSPTTLPATPPAAPPTPAPRTAVPAKVAYSEGQLEVTADNSSLNQILREISRLTGMTITGGVGDQRVFGKYGPAAPARILVDLLEGTGTNMLLRETASAAPAELILTPREGGVTPPNPNAPGFDDEVAPSGVAVRQQPPDQPATNSNPIRPPYNVPGQGSAPPMVGAPPPASDGTTNTWSTPPSSSQLSPGVPLTPEQIYQQLQQLQKTQPPPP